MRLRTLAIPVLGALTTIVVFSGVASAATPIDPVGIGGLIPAPIQPPKGTGTLYETYSTNLGVWSLDEHIDTSWGTDVNADLQLVMHVINTVLMGVIVLIGRCCVVITQWALEGASVPELSDPIQKAISGASDKLVTTLLPACLVVGALVAFGNHKKAHGSALTQIGWLVAAGVFSVSLLTSPGTWIDGVNSTRNIGSDISFAVADAGIGDPGDFPIKMDHKVEIAGKPKDVVMRKAGDAVWRTYVATPWCFAEFGSLEVCQKAGDGLLQQAQRGKSRDDWLDHAVNNDPGNHNSGDLFVGKASVEWRQGKQPAGRFMVLLLGLISIIIYAALALMLAFASIASLLGALMLLICGVVFACLWMIPGRPRQWGVKWFDTLLGMVLQSFVATLVLGCVMIITSACTQTADKLGWFVSSGLSITAAIVAFKLRRLVETIVGSVSGPGALGNMASSMAMRAYSGAASKFLGAGGGGGGLGAGARVSARGAGGRSGGSSGGDDSDSPIPRRFNILNRGPFQAPNGTGNGNAPRPQQPDGPRSQPSSDQRPPANGRPGEPRAGEIGPGSRTRYVPPRRRSVPVGDIRPNQRMHRTADRRQQAQRNPSGPRRQGQRGKAEFAFRPPQPQGNRTPRPTRRAADKEER
ncbi:hypothetical protein [Streptantibioticus ferralitis]|uniref:TrbL/VirB6 plasmid conjugal transfer protein n=1 Tax=Streptantibioticus ferralitis TaxID=236510 RepID=A0ABT5Z424_9ACTN|nr:hypothetical protein [Streptantibioticus ferralitis]MDF2258523.1 hypothetical protein [Streptantibioticus ferralitis]